MLKKPAWSIVGIGLVASMMLGACSSSDSKDAKATATATTAAPKATATEAPKAAATEAPKATAAATQAAAASEVSITLKEFTIAPTPASVKAGEVTFTVKNAGAAPHELVVVKSDADPKKLPVKDGLVDEAVNKPLFRTPTIPAGASGSQKVKLDPGKYVLLCNVPGHYALGMVVAYTVN